MQGKSAARAFFLEIFASGVISRSAAIAAISAKENLGFSSAEADATNLLSHKYSRDARVCREDDPSVGGFVAK